MIILCAMTRRENLSISFESRRYLSWEQQVYARTELEKILTINDLLLRKSQKENDAYAESIIRQINFSAKSHFNNGGLKEDFICRFESIDLPQRIVARIEKLYETQDKKITSYIDPSSHLESQYMGPILEDYTLVYRPAASLQSKGSRHIAAGRVELVGANHLPVLKSAETP